MSDIRLVDNELGRNLFRQIIDLWVQPEVKRRSARGELSAGARISAIQVILRVGKRPEVRLNEEVRTEARAHAAEGVEVHSGMGLRADEIEGIEDVVLTADEDPNAAHITALALRGGWTIAFDFRYNARLISEHLEAADEFMGAAVDELEKDRLRAFCELGYAATELFVRAELLTLPDGALLKSKKHSLFSSRYNAYANLGNADLRFGQLLNQLERLRGPARYLDGELRIERDEAEEMLKVLREMREHVRARSPRSPRPDTAAA